MIAVRPSRIRPARSVRVMFTVRHRGTTRWLRAAESCLSHLLVLHCCTNHSGRHPSSGNRDLLPPVGCPRSLPGVGMRANSGQHRRERHATPATGRSGLQEEVSTVPAAYGQVTTDYWPAVVIGAVLLLALLMAAA